ncbi:hypothetical protein HOG98_06635 [bacterium]|nr:hypothetical protein [bacterium]
MAGPYIHSQTDCYLTELERIGTAKDISNVECFLVFSSKIQPVLSFLKEMENDQSLEAAHSVTIAVISETNLEKQASIYQEMVLTIPEGILADTKTHLEKNPQLSNVLSYLERLEKMKDNPAFALSENTIFEVSSKYFYIQKIQSLRERLKALDTEQKTAILPFLEQDARTKSMLSHVESIESDKASEIIHDIFLSILSESMTHRQIAIIRQKLSGIPDDLDRRVRPVLTEDVRTRDAMKQIIQSEKVKHKTLKPRPLRDAKTHADSIIQSVTSANLSGEKIIALQESLKHVPSQHLKKVREIISTDPRSKDYLAIVDLGTLLISPEIDTYAERIIEAVKQEKNIRKKAQIIKFELGQIPLHDRRFVIEKLDNNTFTSFHMPVSENNKKAIRPPKQNPATKKANVPSFAIYHDPEQDPSISLRKLARNTKKEPSQVNTTNPAVAAANSIISSLALMPSSAQRHEKFTLVKNKLSQTHVALRDQVIDILRANENTSHLIANFGKQDKEKCTIS